MKFLHSSNPACAAGIQYECTDAFGNPLVAGGRSHGQRIYNGAPPSQGNDAECGPSFGLYSWNRVSSLSIL